MYPKYMPILKAKKGELDAIKSMLPYPHVMRDMLPIFEIPYLSKKQRTNKKYSNIGNPVEFFLNNTIKTLSERMQNLPMGIDISRWPPNSSLETGEHILSHLTSALRNAGCNIIPVVGYDRWEDDEYATTLQQLGTSYNDFVIRLNSFAFEDMIEEEPFIETIEGILTSLGAMPENCSVMIDLEDITKTSIVDLNETVQRALDSLYKYDFKFISIAGSSITSDINGMVPTHNSEGIVIRKEAKVWKAFKKFQPDLNLVFGDYGIVNPSIGDDIIAPDANGKIRYTIDDSLFVVRGYSRATGKKGAQMQDLCKILVSSPHYKGEKFSWGDKKIYECANEEFVGNTTNWVSIDTTHHVTHIVAEVREFELILQHQRDYQKQN
ncbi:TPA: beta family protein [Klebsiella aerogenes]|nr:beta family protein [Salmonella enterica]HDT4317122.1 beta family protein [Klebsiella aerogenes]